MADERKVVRKAFESAKSRTLPKIAELKDPDRVFEFPGDLEAGRLLNFMEQYGDMLGDADEVPATVAPAFLRIVFAEQWETIKEPPNEGGLYVTEMTEVANWLATEYGLVAAVAEVAAEEEDDEGDGDSSPS